MTALPTLEPGWDEQVVRSLLENKGNLLHVAIAVDKDSREWLYTRQDLAAIAPPLTRILNRYDTTRAAAATGDEIAVVIGMSGYVARSVKERRAAIARMRAAYEPEQPTVPAPPGTGPSAAGEEPGGGFPPPMNGGGVTSWTPEEGSDE